MSRIAYLRIPRFQIVVHQKREKLKNVPFALVSGKLTPSGYNRARIFMCSTEAGARQVQPGMRLSEAKAFCSDLILQECDDVLYESAQRQLVQKLVSCSPKIASQETGEFSLDASGLFHLGGESRFCHDVLRLCAKRGFTEAHIGIADTTFAAKVAARLKRRKLLLIPAGQDAAFLAPLSIRFLELAPEMEESLIHLGITKMGQLANLPVSTLVERYGTAGQDAHDLASGIDRRQPTLPETIKQYECSVDMGGAISNWNETAFAFKTMLDRLTKDLKIGGLCAEELLVSFYNEDDKFDERELRLIRSSNHTKFLLEVIRLALEANPLDREFTKIKLAVSRFAKEGWEQNRIASPALSMIGDERKLSTPLIMLLQRLMTRVGDNKAVKPVASDHYSHEDAGAWVSVTKNSHTDAIIPIDLDYLNNSAGRQLVSDLVLKKCSPAPQVIVELNNATPLAINHDRQWYRIKHITTPELLSGNWWERDSSRSYYKVFAEPTQREAHKQAPLFMLLAHDHLQNNWFIEGFFD